MTAGPEHPRLEWQIGAADSDQRLDRFLAERLGLSRAQTRRLFDDGLVDLGGRRVGRGDKGTKLLVGQFVRVDGFVHPEDLRATPEPQTPLVVLAEGDGWFVADKPPGVPIHPLRRDETGTLLNAALARYPEMHGVGDGGLASGVVHRLDVDTSGTVLMATRQEHWERFRQAFHYLRGRRTTKIYRAIVLGRLEGSGEIRERLAVTRHSPARVSVVGDRPGHPASRGSRRCRLEWRAVEALRGATLVEVALHSGFLHQIRVMFSHLGHPLAGERSYRLEDVPDATGAPRQMLHAARLEVDEVSAASPDAADFGRCLELLRSID